MVSPSEVRSTLGTTVGKPRATFKGTVTTCTYSAANSAQSVIIQYVVAATRITFAQDEAKIQAQQGPTTPITGLGNEAYSVSLMPGGGDTVNSVVTLKGSLQTVVTSTSSLDQVEGMARLILANLAKIKVPTTTTSSSG
ncbi:MAG: hypothetical protein ACLQPH_18420 [Acidimicrobiales bacterium]